MDKLSDAAQFNDDAIRAAHDEMAEYRRQLQSRIVELETLKGTRDSLERQRCETEHQHQGDMTSLQAGQTSLARPLNSLLFHCVLHSWC